MVYFINKSFFLGSMHSDSEKIKELEKRVQELEKALSISNSVKESFREILSESHLRELRRIKEAVYKGKKLFSYVDMFGDVKPFNGDETGGDGLIVFAMPISDIQFDKRIEEAKSKKLRENLMRTRDKILTMVYDVKGHGQEVSPNAAIIHHLLKKGVRDQLDTYGHVTKGLAESINNHLVDSHSFGKNTVEMTHFELNPDGLAMYINASHHNPLIYRSSGDKLLIVPGVPSPPLGFLKYQDIDSCAEETGNLHSFEVYRFKLQQGDRLLIFSDGFGDVEKEESDERFIGISELDLYGALKSSSWKEITSGSLKQELRYCSEKNLSARLSYHHIISSLENFCNTSNDDRTLLVIDYLGKDSLME
jgi:hypothetical protein